MSPTARSHCKHHSQQHTIILPHQLRYYHHKPHRQELLGGMLDQRFQHHCSKQSHIPRKYDECDQRHRRRDADASLRGDLLRGSARGQLLRRCNDISQRYVQWQLQRYWKRRQLYQWAYHHQRRDDAGASTGPDYLDGHVALGDNYCQ